MTEDTQTASAFSAPDLFYLEHRAQIEEWADLRRGASLAIDHHLRGAMSELRDHDPEWTIAGDLPQRYAGVVLAPASVDRPASVLIGAFWKPSTVMPAVRPDAPFVGIHVEPTQFEARASQTLDRIDSQDANGPHDTYKTAPPWIRWRYVVADERWWEEPNTYSQQLAGEVTALLARYGPALRSLTS
ncbi:MAG: hypothetical protein R2699_15630 [Acidimicrobiales bacterium]